MKTLALPLLVLSSLSAACSGGGGGGGNRVEPCCNAQGQTDPPPAGPAFAFVGGGELVEGRFAQPIVLSSSSCLSLNDPVLLMPDFDSVGKPVEVAADGSFTVDINERGVGREVAIRIYDELSDGTRVDRAVTYLAKPPVTNPAATPIPVAPILFEGRIFAEGTVEAAAYCAMKVSATGSGDDLQNLTLSDIRAVVTSGFANAFVPGANRESVLGPLRHYRHALNGLVDPTKNGGFPVTSPLRDLRYDIDEEIDACLLGRTDLVSLPACLTGPDFYRSWLLVNASSTIPFAGNDSEEFRTHLFVTTQDMTDAISRVDASNEHLMELLRSNYRMRYEIQADVIRNSVICFGDTAVPCDPATPPTLDADPLAIGSINTLLQLLHDQIEAAETPSELSNLVFNRNLDMASVFGSQIGIAGDAAFFQEQQFANNALTNIQDTFTHEQIAGEIATQLAATNADLTATYTQFTSAADRALLTEFMFYTNASALQLVVDDTFAGACFGP